MEMDEDIIDLIATIRAIHYVTQDNDLAKKYILEMFTALEKDLELTPFDWLEQQGSLSPTLN